MWKARLEAYDELTKIFQRADGPKDAVFRTYSDAARNAPSEANAAALESALGCLLAYIKCSDSGTRLRPAVLPTLIEKCIAAARPGARARCLEALMQFAELDSAEPVLTELGAFANHKQPKVVSGCFNAMTEIIKYGAICVIYLTNFYREFGAADKAVVKAAAKHLGAAFQHADKMVRAEGSALAVELYRWVGKALEPFLDALKPIQVILEVLMRLLIRFLG